MCPEQNSQAGAGTGVKPPVAGSQTWGVPVRPIVSTRPVGRSTRCTATMGQGKGWVHSPLSPEVIAAKTGAVGAGVHGTAPLARATRGFPLRRICTVPVVRVSMYCSLTAGSMVGAAGTSTVPSSLLPATR